MWIRLCYFDSSTLTMGAGLTYLIEHGCHLMEDILPPLQQGNGDMGLGMKYLTQLLQGDAAIEGR